MIRFNRTTLRKLAARRIKLLLGAGVGLVVLSVPVQILFFHFFRVLLRTVKMAPAIFQLPIAIPIPETPVAAGLVLLFFLLQPVWAWAKSFDEEDNDNQRIASPGHAGAAELIPFLWETLFFFCGLFYQGCVRLLQAWRLHRTPPERIEAVVRPLLEHKRSAAELAAAAGATPEHAAWLVRTLDAAIDLHNPPELALAPAWRAAFEAETIDSEPFT